jgi:hypothetical protein
MNMKHILKKTETKIHILYIMHYIQIFYKTNLKIRGQQGKLGTRIILDRTLGKHSMTM